MKNIKFQELLQEQRAMIIEASFGDKIKKALYKLSGKERKDNYKKFLQIASRLEKEIPKDWVNIEFEYVEEPNKYRIYIPDVRNEGMFNRIKSILANIFKKMNYELLGFDWDYKGYGTIKGKFVLSVNFKINE